MNKKDFIAKTMIEMAKVIYPTSEIPEWMPPKEDAELLATEAGIYATALWEKYRQIINTIPDLDLGSLEKLVKDTENENNSKSIGRGDKGHCNSGGVGGA